MGYQVRMATAEDMDLLVKLRFDYLTAEGWDIPPDLVQPLEENFRQYYHKHLGTDFFAVFAGEDGAVSSVAFLLVDERPANWLFLTGRTGLLLNVYTEARCRGRGLASLAIETLIETAKAQNVSYIELSSSRLGRPLYEKFGFRETDHGPFTEMKLELL